MHLQASWLPLQHAQLIKAPIWQEITQEYTGATSVLQSNSWPKINSEWAEQQSLDRAKGRQDSHADMLAKVNERNRKANLEAVRKAELMEAERKRRERRAAMAGTGTPVPSDPSARLKVTPRTFIATPNATRCVLVLLDPFFGFLLWAG